MAHRFCRLDYIFGKRHSGDTHYSQMTINSCLYFSLLTKLTIFRSESESLAVSVGLRVKALHLIGGVVLREDGEDGAYLHPPLRAGGSPEHHND